MYIKNCWYVAAWSDEVSADQLFSRTILNMPILLWRDRQGQIHAMLDRCCHRHAPLSLGKKVDDCIQCNYHGLVFNSQGQCVSAPVESNLSLFRVKTFAVHEINQWIWIWMGDPAQADPNQIPNIWWYAHPDWAYKPNGYLKVAAHYLLIADNLLDFSHLPFVHPSTLGGSADYASILPSVKRHEHGIRLEKMIKKTQPPGYSKHYSDYPEGALVDRWMYYDFLIPGILLLDVGMFLSDTGSYEHKPENALSFLSAQAITPENEQSTHYFFAQARDFALDRDAVSEEIYQGILKAFHEDIEMILGQQKNINLDPTMKAQPFSVDSALAQFRWLIDKRLVAEQPTHNPTTPWPAP